jgi:hypothetical protein
MAWDSKTTQRRRQNSNAASRSSQSAHEIPPPIEAYAFKSTHVSDPALQPFLAPTFDAASFLNSTLPPLKTKATAQRSNSKDVPLAELSTQTQTLLSHLSAHTTRLTSTLTQLTDEILRSGSRLAYEVEVLRGETLGLSEALMEGLQEDISRFVPSGLEKDLARRPSKTEIGHRRVSTVVLPKTPIEETKTETNNDPVYITQLRTLTQVRNRLDTVIKTFGDAMSWTFPPSEVSVGSAFLSVSAPEPGSEAESIEEKGQQVSKRHRDEIADLLISNEDPVDGIEAAAKRVEELKELSKVWKGTAEEKARMKFVESLAKMVEDRHRELLREAEHQSRAGQKVESKTAETGSATEKPQSGYNFMNQFQKMRGGL